MNWRKFDDLLRTSSHYFSRPDKFEDPFEGRLSPGYKTSESKSWKAFKAAYGINFEEQQGNESREIMRRVVFISCWHRARNENRRMWEAYTKGNSESVVVVTSAKALSTFLPESIVKSGLKYHENDFPRTMFSHTAIFFYKPVEYCFEREYRLLLAPGETESIGAEEYGRHVRVNLKTVLHRVITHPRATNSFKQRVDELMSHYLKSLRREDSSLLP